MITKENYEAYLLDRLEGNLSEEEEQRLNDFLSEHPELNDLDVMDEHTKLFPLEEDSFDKERVIFDEINAKNYHYFFIAYIENQLTENQKKEVELFIENHSEFSTVFRQYNATKLKASPVVFEEKNALLNKTTPIYHMNSGVLFRIAAVVVLFFFGYVAIEHTGLIQKNTPVLVQKYVQEKKDLVPVYYHFEEMSDSSALEMRDFNNQRNHKFVSEEKSVHHDEIRPLKKDEHLQFVQQMKEVPQEERHLPLLFQEAKLPIRENTIELNSMDFALIYPVTKQVGQKPAKHTESEVKEAKTYILEQLGDRVKNPKNMLALVTKEVVEFVDRSDVSSTEREGRNIKKYTFGNLSVERVLAKKEN